MGLQSGEQVITPLRHQYVKICANSTSDQLKTNM